MSDSSEVRISLIEESVPGTTPATPAMLVLQTTGQTMADVVNYLESQTITNNRNVKDMIRVDRSSGGGIPCEMTFSRPTEALGQAIRAALHSANEDAEVLVLNSSATILAEQASPNDTVTRSTGSWVSDDIQEGDIIRLEDGADTIYREVGAVTATVLTLVGSTLTDDFACDVRRGARMENGTVKKHFSLEVSRQDVDLHQVFVKQVFNTAAITIAAGAITQIAFGMTGGLSTPSGTEIGASYTEPTATDNIMDAVAVPLLLVGGVEYEVTSVSINIDNGARARTRVGTDSVGTIARGNFRVTGSVSYYKQDHVQLLKFLNNQTTSVAVVQEDEQGQAWSYRVPRAKYTRNATPTNGPNQDEVESVDYQAIQDATGVYSLRVQRFSAI